MTLHTLILAAGEGRRFGGDLKQLACVDERTLLELCVDKACALTPNRVSIVLGYEAKQLSPRVGQVHQVINSDWSRGIGNSIACGVAALPRSASAVLIVLCDQVALSLADLGRLRECYEQLIYADKGVDVPIVCATYAGGQGVPAIIPRRLFGELRALDGDLGAKKLLSSHPFVGLAMPQAAIDIDTQEDLVQFRAALVRAFPYRLT